MGFWDRFAEVFTKDIPGLINGDTYFPDNTIRQVRAEELIHDCNSRVANITQLYPKIKEVLKILDEKIASLPGAKSSDTIASEIKFSGSAFEVSQMILPLFVAPAVYSAMSVAATSYLAASGEIGAAALVELVGLPAFFEVGIGAAAGVLTIAVVPAIGAIEGTIKRDKLRDAIHGGVRSRLKLEKDYVICSSTYKHLRALSEAVDALKVAGLYKDLVIDKVKEMIKESITEANGIKDYDIFVSLYNLDASRNSWISEDDFSVPKPVSVSRLRYV